VTVTPSPASATTTQPVSVKVTVTGSSGATPTGTITLSSGTYTSAAATLSGGSASITISAGTLAAGSDTLTASYSPDAASSSTYNDASGTAPVTVTAAALITPTVTVTPSATVIASTQAWTVAVTLSGGAGAAAPTGSVTLTIASYTTAAVTLSGGSATINVPAGAVVSGNNTLTVNYTPDAASSSIYASASGTASVTVPAGTSYVVTVDSTNPSSGVPISQVCTNSVCPALVPAPIPTPFTLVAGAGASFGLLAPATAGGNTFAGWAGCTLTTVTVAEECNLTVNGNMTVTALYSTPTGTITPTVTVTPSASSITTAQPLTVTVAVSGGGSNPAPTGSVTLVSGSYASAATTLSSGSALIVIPAGTLATGINKLTATYTPDAASSSSYNSASGTNSVTVVQGYVLTVNSTNPASGVAISVNPNSLTPLGYPATTSFTVGGQLGQVIGLIAPATAGSNDFASWTGCTSSSGYACNATLNANMTVTANYAPPGPTSITVTPGTATIGAQQQFTATVNGVGAYSNGVTWSLTCPLCGSLSPGTLSSAGLYTTPYPAPTSVTVTATSTQAGFTNVIGSATVTLTPPATAAGPALSVNVGTPGNPISPDIYGMDAYLLHGTAADTAAVAPTNITVDRWGGDSTERYNFQLDVTNDIDDWFFENNTGNGGDGWPAVNGVKAFDALVESNNSNGIKTLGTVPVLGWVAKDSTSCSFPKSTYPDQLAVNNKPAFSTDGRNCGSGIYPNGVAGCTNSNGCDIPSDPTVTSIAEPPPTAPANSSGATTAWAEATWPGSWVNYLVNKFGAGNSGTGVAIYDLDNEPTWWDSNDFDVHPAPFTYDEVTNGGIGTALAIKTVDPTAQVSGPVIDYWWAYFYSKRDIESGWSSGPCYEPWNNPIDREAHGGVPLIEYYLQQFAAAQNTYGFRLLDYVDLHTYFAANYPAGSGNSVAFATAGDTGAQAARLNSTRAFWDPAYTDSSNNYAQPNYPTDPNYYNPTTHGNCNIPQQAPQLIRMMKTWVANDYPGTKTAIDEYNWGGMESISGALAQADILGIFGREGLDLGTMWPTEDPSGQIPGMMAFAIYRNYDGSKSTFGDTVLPSASTNSSNGDSEGQLAVYGAVHTSGASKGTVTVIVINKTYGPLTSTVSFLNFTPPGGATAQVYQYSNANLGAIEPQAAVNITPPSGSGTTSTINYTFPAQSITLFVVP
jgi:hypothetical protein